MTSGYNHNSLGSLMKAAIDKGFQPMLLNPVTGELLEINDYVTKYKTKTICLHTGPTYIKTRTFSNNTTHKELICAKCNQHIKFISKKSKPDIQYD